MEISATESISQLMQDEGQTEVSNQDGDMLGKDDFLQLLVTQLENQDPLEPMDPEQMTAQLAQFSSLEQLNNISDSMEGLDSMTQSLDQARALDMLGKEVLLEGNSFSLGENEISLSYRLENEADEVTVYVTDSSGQEVVQLSAAGTSPGEHSVTWNGENNDGDLCPSGQYTFVVEASKAGEELTTEPFVLAQVTGVDYSESGEIMLQSSAGELALSQVETIHKSANT